MTDQCLNPACGHALPRRVNFCPYCGTPQHAGVVRPTPPIQPPAPAGVTLAKPAPAIASVAEPRAPIPPVAPALPPAPQAAEPSRPAGKAAIPTAIPAVPPQRQPLHWIWWLVGLGLLWLAWITARPAAHKLDARIDAAIVMAQECKGKQAQSELIALRATRATPAQLQRLQTALNAASTACDRKRAHDKAWADARTAIDAALAASAPEKARTRLGAFTRRWGEDEETAAARARIDAAKREQAPPAAPSRESTSRESTSRESAHESARNLMAEAERDISRGNYRGAIDKMDTCVGMVDAGNRDCMAVKARAERLYKGL